MQNFPIIATSLKKKQARSANSSNLPPQPPSQSEPAWLAIFLDNVKRFHKKKRAASDFVKIHQSLDRMLLRAGGTNGHIQRALQSWIDINPTVHVSDSVVTDVAAA